MFESIIYMQTNKIGTTHNIFKQMNNPKIRILIKFVQTKIV